jgi:2-amino-4-hydroxy-6-hydroxymethyldihydropteridine diphosphokinase
VPPDRRDPCGSIAVALGANLGDPAATLVAVRPRLQSLLQAGGVARCRWSPLFRTEPVGGPAAQRDYLNAAVVVDQIAAGAPPDPWRLLARLQDLEAVFGRQRQQRWGPRHLDLDMLWCGALRFRAAALELPHPRLLERTFVLAPLAAIEPSLVPPGQRRGPLRDAASLLAELLPLRSEAPPQRLPPRSGWPE